MLIQQAGKNVLSIKHVADTPSSAGDAVPQDPRPIDTVQRAVEQMQELCRMLNNLPGVTATVTLEISFPDRWPPRHPHPASAEASALSAPAPRKQIPARVGKQVPVVAHARAVQDAREADAQAAS